MKISPYTRNEQYVEFPISEITYVHPVPNPARIGDPKHIPVEALMEIFQRDGFDIFFAVPLVRTPDGKHYCSGHHRTEAMRRLGETTVPALIRRWEDLPDSYRREAALRYPEIFGVYYFDNRGIYMDLD